LPKTSHSSSPFNRAWIREVQDSFSERQSGAQLKNGGIDLLKSTTGLLSATKVFAWMFLVVKTKMVSP